MSPRRKPLPAADARPAPGSCQCAQAAPARDLENLLHTLPRPNVINEVRQFGTVLEEEGAHCHGTVFLCVLLQLQMRRPCVSRVPAACTDDERPEVELREPRLGLAARGRSLGVGCPACCNGCCRDWRVATLRWRRVLALCCPQEGVHVQSLVHLPRRRAVAVTDHRPVAIVRRGPVGRQPKVLQKGAFHREEPKRGLCQ